MYVISSSTRSQNREPRVIRDTNQVSIKPLLQFGRDPVAALFPTENTVYEVCSMSMRMRHSATLNLN
jgi:hypothetical protein